MKIVSLAPNQRLNIESSGVGSSHGTRRKSRKRHWEGQDARDTLSGGVGSSHGSGRRSRKSQQEGQDARDTLSGGVGSSHGSGRKSRKSQQEGQDARVTLSGGVGSSCGTGRKSRKSQQEGQDARDTLRFFNDQRPITWARIRAESNRFEELRLEKLKVLCKYYKAKLLICQKSMLNDAEWGETISLEERVNKLKSRKSELGTRCATVQRGLCYLLQNFNYHRVIVITCPGDVIALHRARLWAVPEPKPNPGPSKKVKYRLGLSAKGELLDEIDREARRSNIALPQLPLPRSEIVEMMV